MQGEAEVSPSFRERTSGVESAALAPQCHSDTAATGDVLLALVVVAGLELVSIWAGR